MIFNGHHVSSLSICRSYGTLAVSPFASLPAIPAIQWLSVMCSQTNQLRCVCDRPNLLAIG